MALLLFQCTLYSDLTAQVARTTADLTLIAGCAVHTQGTNHCVLSVVHIFILRVAPKSQLLNLFISPCAISAECCYYFHNLFII